MARVQLFLSTVTAEFLTYREHLRHLLTRPNVEMKVQEDFIVTGDETLEMLDTYIQGCDGVIHLVGDMAGAIAKAPSVLAIARRHPELAHRFPLADHLRPDGPSLSYTQWEAWLALLHGKPLFIATPTPEAPRHEAYGLEAGQQELQLAHLARLRRVSRYPGLTFTSPDDLAAGVLRSFVLDLLVTAERSGLEITPHNLPQATGSAVPLVGRDAALVRLAQLLEAGQAPVWITGMDGVGKSALALYHLRQRLEVYGGGVVVLDGQRPLAGLVEQVEQFARVHFDQQVPDVLPPEARLAWLYSHWPLPKPVALLLDEPQDPAAVEALGRGLPERFRLLVTSRRQLGTASQRVPLQPLDAGDAVTLLTSVSERGLFRGGEERHASEVAREVGGLPLALWLLGRRLARDGDLEVEELCRRVREKGALARVLQPTAADPLQPRGLRTGFQLAWEALSPAERELALLLGTLPPTAVPWELLALCAPPGHDPDDWPEARVGLEQQHLIERPLAGLVACHPLLHDLFAAEAREGEEAGRRARLVDALAAWLPQVSEVLAARSRDKTLACRPLLEAVAQWPADAFGASAAGLPLLALGRLHSAIGAYGAAEVAFRQGMDQARGGAGDGADRVRAGCLVGLAGIARERGQLKKAERQCHQALALLGHEGAEPAGDHAERALDLADALNGLGLVWHELGVADAEEVLRRSLALRLHQLGATDRLVQVSRNNLARNLARQGRIPEAQALYRQALEALRDDPCEVAMALHNNLASLAMAQDRREEALTELREAVRLAVQALGEHHPRRGELLQNLAIVEELLGHRPAAETHYRLALDLMLQAWGPEDPRSEECQLTLEAFLAEHQR
jgi:tetratricopeptide (TPR) repeat protein